VPQLRLNLEGIEGKLMEINAAMVIRTIFVALSCLLVFSVVEAKEYGRYDLKRVVPETSSGKQPHVDGRYLDQILNDLGLHARNYPPRFDTPADRERAVRDVKYLSGLLDVLIDGPSPNSELLFRACFLNSIGHNLDISGSAEKANSIFKRLLAISPSDPRANYHYGTFLAGATRYTEAIPYLQKALAAGLADAAYGLGMTYLSLGDKDKALDHLEAYRQRKPNDEKIPKIIDAVRNGNPEINLRFGMSSNRITFDAEPLLRLYYISFDIHTYNPVTKGGISKERPIVFMKEHPFIPELLKSLQAHSPYKRIPSENPTAPLEPSQKDEVDLERGNYRLKADFGSSIGVFWVNKGGGVVKDDGTVFFLSKSETELLEQKIRYFLGVVDTSVVSQIDGVTK
jgi:tetratricopeptide (TPR) repeat protein